jgi:hypothetical protein
MNRRETKSPLGYVGAPMRWLHAATQVLDDGMAVLCERQWREARFVPVQAAMRHPSRFRGSRR